MLEKSPPLCIFDSCKPSGAVKIMGAPVLPGLLPGAAPEPTGLLGLDGLPRFGLPAAGPEGLDDLLEPIGVLGLDGLPRLGPPRLGPPTVVPPAAGPEGLDDPPEPTGAPGLFGLFGLFEPGLAPGLVVPVPPGGVTVSLTTLMALGTRSCTVREAFQTVNG